VSVSILTLYVLKEIQKPAKEKLKDIDLKVSNLIDDDDNKDLIKL